MYYTTTGKAARYLDFDYDDDRYVASSRIHRSRPVWDYSDQALAKMQEGRH